MALLSGAGSPHGLVHKLLPEWQSQPRITPTTIIDHSIVGSALGAYFFFRDSTGIESHFIIGLDGEIWQLMDTGREADANNEANRYAISIETADNGNPNTFAWTARQLDSLKWLHNKLRAVHPTIPRKKATSCESGGLGFHSQMGAPGCWTPAAGKTCPGKPVRVSQWNNILVPAFVNPEEDDMPTADEIEDAVAKALERDRPFVAKATALEVAESLGPVLDKYMASGLVFISNLNNPTAGVFLVTSGQLIHVQNPGQFGIISGDDSDAVIKLPGDAPIWNLPTNTEL